MPRWAGVLSSVGDRKGAPMELRMSVAEQALFKSFLPCAKSYFEFGSGGSTILAAKTVAGAVCSVESDRDWIEKVKSSSSTSDYERSFLFVDIGPTGDWGKPIKPHGEVNYLNYHTLVWERVTQRFDLYFIDGRFRVACFCQCLLRSDDNAIIGVHDYRSRHGYHVIETLAKPIAEAEDLTFFRKSGSTSAADIATVLTRYSLNVA